MTTYAGIIIGFALAVAIFAGINAALNWKTDRATAKRLDDC